MRTVLILETFLVAARVVLLAPICIGVLSRRLLLLQAFKLVAVGLGLVLLLEPIARAILGYNLYFLISRILLPLLLDQRLLRLLFRVLLRFLTIQIMDHKLRLKSTLFLKLQLMDLHRVREQLVYPSLHEGHLENLPDRWSLVRVFYQHL